MDETLAAKNNNPGDLRFVGQQGATQGKGGFAAFSSPQAGGAALLNQLQTNINNKPTETLEQFASNYAPADDGNNVPQYTANLANQLGVSPITPIGSLEPQIGQFAEAVAHNEDSNVSAAQPAKSNLGLGTAIGAGVAGIAGLAGSALKAGASALPELGALGGEVAGAALAPETGGLSLAIPAAGAAVGTEAGNAVKGLIGTNAPETAQSATPGSTTNQDISLGDTTDYSPVASAIKGALSNTIGGNNVMQEGERRGIPDVGQAMAQMGLVPGVDENGNYDKISPTLLANAGNSQDQGYLEEAVAQMRGQTSLDDMEREAIQEAKLALGSNSPDLDSTIKEIQKTFEGYGRQHEQQTDKNGRPLARTQQFKAPSDVLQMEQYAARRGRNYALPPHERDASQHIKASLRKRLSSMAKKEGVKGLDETFKRMETRFLIKKAIKALPKKATRDHRKEFIHHLVSGLGGALIGKTLGHGLIGGTAGYLLSSKLEKKRYKSLADKKIAGLLAQKSKEKPKNLLSKAPNKQSASNQK